MSKPTPDRNLARTLGKTSSDELADLFTRLDAALASGEISTIEALVSQVVRRQRAICEWRARLRKSPRVSEPFLERFRELQRRLQPLVQRIRIRSLEEFLE